MHNVRMRQPRLHFSRTYKHGSAPQRASEHPDPFSTHLREYEGDPNPGLHTFHSDMSCSIVAFLAASADGRPSLGGELSLRTACGSAVLLGCEQQAQFCLGDLDFKHLPARDRVRLGCDAKAFALKEPQERLRVPYVRQVRELALEAGDLGAAAVAAEQEPPLRCKCALSRSERECGHQEPSDCSLAHVLTALPATRPNVAGEPPASAASEPKTRA